MSIARASLAAALLVAGVSLAAAEDTPPPAAPQEPQWTVFQSATQRFAISFPGAPKVTSAPVEGQNPLVQHDFQASVGEDAVYTVVVFEYPAGKAPSSPDTDYYLKIVNAYAKGSETRLRKRGPATLAGRQGFEAIADDGKNKATHVVNIVPAGDRVYMVVSAGARGRDMSEDAERFRGSFRLLDDQAQSATGSTDE
jgi:hypothetical protein